MRPRMYSDEQLLDLILGAFADLGFEGTSVRALCRHLGVSHNLIHERYGSKDQMWYAAVDYGFDEMWAKLLAPLDGELDDLERLRLWMTRFAEGVLARPALLRIVNQEAARPGPRFDYVFTHYIEPAHKLADDLISSLQATGAFRPGPISTIYYFLVSHGVGSMASLAQISPRLGGPALDEETLRATVDVIIDGLRA